MTPSDRSALAALCLAVDAPSLDEARRWAEPLAEHVGVLKIGLELFTREGPAAVAWARGLGRDVFLDLKLHDIPATVDRAVAAAASLGVRFLTLHASGGTAMLERAARRANADAGAGAGNEGLRLLAVTVLTSLDDRDLAAVGVSRGAGEHALALARLAHAAGVTGFVCSGAEVGELRRALPDAFFVTPGVRPAGPLAASDDQRRVVSAEQAVAAGSDLVVVGRPLRDAADPAAAARALRAEITAGQARRAR
ncbi:MAG: orotidine-5'-phosphate decarboxylase [Polyangiaceae bacterium]|nr:orotidine-5'-phosphate decarboxylase [Polyangiaceae bacterium]